MSDKRADEWETEEVDVVKPVGVVVSVRLDQALADELFQETERRGLSTSAFVREAITAYLEQRHESAGATEISVSSSNGAPVRLTTGGGGQARTVGADSTTEFETVPG